MNDLLQHHLSQSGHQLAAQNVGEGHVLWGFVGGIADHQTLVSGTDFFQLFVLVDTLSDIWTLLIKSNQNLSGFVVTTLLNVIIANFFEGVSDNLFKDDVRGRADLTENDS